MSDDSFNNFHSLDSALADFNDPFHHDNPLNPLDSALDNPFQPLDSFNQLDSFHNPHHDALFQSDFHSFNSHHLNFASDACNNQHDIHVSSETYYGHHYVYDHQQHIGYTDNQHIYNTGNNLVGYFDLDGDIYRDGYNNKIAHFDSCSGKIYDNEGHVIGHAHSHVEAAAEVLLTMRGGTT
ncbi:MAG: hypothetical protein R2880_19170 [Deinococcales bacterium]